MKLAYSYVEEERKARMDRSVLGAGMSKAAKRPAAGAPVPPAPPPPVLPIPSVSDKGKGKGKGKETPKGKGKGNGKGKKGESRPNSSQSTPRASSDGRRFTPGKCREVINGGTCPRGDGCYFVHDDSQAELLRALEVRQRSRTSLAVAARRQSAASPDLWTGYREVCVPRTASAARSVTSTSS